MVLFKKGQKGINLAPEAEKAAKGAENTLVIAFMAGGFVLLILAISLIFVALNISKSQESNRLEKEFSEKLAPWNQLAPIAKQSVGLKIKATQIKDLNSSNANFKESLERLRKYVPDTVKLESLTLKSGNSFKVQATSVRSAELYQFVNTLEEQDQYFEGVDISSLVKNEDNYILNLDLKYKPQ